MGLLIEQVARRGKVDPRQPLVAMGFDLDHGFAADQRGAGTDKRKRNGGNRLTGRTE